jgi:hypothetical protein
MQLKKVLMGLLMFLVTFISVSGQDIARNKIRIGKEKFSYYVMTPKQTVVGILILLPGWGEKPQAIFNKTRLPLELAEKGFITVVPELPQTLFIDDITISELNEIYKSQIEKFQLHNSPLVVGGLSAGGSLAIGYAEHVLSSDSPTNLKAVFAIDPPLDLRRMYASAERKIKYSCGGLIRKEGYFIKSYLESSLGGPPEKSPQKYLASSAFSAEAKDGGNARFLKNIPIRIYSEPDLEFVRSTYCAELQFSDINAFDLERLSAYLSNAGNKKVEYITTKDKGFHTWNIVDAEECTQWIMSLTK